LRLKRNIALSESGFIFNPANGDSFSVNPIGLAILGFLKEGASIEELQEKLVTMYQVKEDQLAEDLHDFTSHLNQLNLLENESA
jgi:hypothetical protein